MHTAGLAAALLALHVVAWGLLLVVVPHHFTAGTQVFGVGLGVTAYTLGMRHAFDADHIAVIDNTTRKLMAEGQRPVSLGFWFAIGHSTVVVVLAMLLALGTRLADTLLDDGSSTHRTLGLVGASVSGLFLYLIGVLNLVALVGIARAFRRARQGRHDEAALEAALASRGLFARLLAGATRSITRPAQLYPVGLLLGLGFDTATEVTLLVLASSSAAGGVPVYAVLVLPLLFAAGMSLFDSLDGTFMTVAYSWAFANPLRKIYYNLTVTGLSVAVALLLGTVELVGVVREQVGLTDPVSGALAGLPMDRAGYVVVALFVLAWALAVGYWRLAKLESPRPGPVP